jgi:MerR family redox-sensitive transcriptional activator SoxR
MRIGEIAERAGLHTSAVRYYEQVGLLPEPDRESGRRVYDESILDRLAVLQFAKGCGFTIREMRELMAPLLRATPISKRWQKLARAKLEELEELISRAQSMRQYLAAALECQCHDAPECGRTIRRQSRDRGVAVIADSRGGNQARLAPRDRLVPLRTNPQRSRTR